MSEKLDELEGVALALWQYGEPGSVERRTARLAHDWIMEVLER